MKAKSLFLLLLLPSLAAANPRNAAVELATADALAFPEGDRLYLRWLYVYNADFEEAQASSHAVASTSLASAVVPLKDQLIGKDKLMLVRLDFKRLYDTDEDRVRALEVFEDLRFDPAWSLNLTRDTLKFLLRRGLDPSLKLYCVSRDWEKRKTVRVEDEAGKCGDYVVKRVQNPTIDPVKLFVLQEMVCSAIPIADHQYDIIRRMRTIRDKDKFDGLFDTIYGGRYFRFLNLPQGSKDPKKTDLDGLLFQLGVRTEFRKLFDELHGDKRVAMWKSKITNRTRAVLYIPVLVGPDMFVDGPQPVLVITLDVERANFDISNHAMMNLLDIADRNDANEVRFFLRNGHMASALYNGTKKGQLLDEAANNVVHDTRVVPGHAYDALECGKGCMGCHDAIKGNDGWQDLSNDVLDITAGLKRGLKLDILDDIGGQFKSRDEAVSRLVGLYGGEPSKLIGRLRDTHSASVLRTTGPWKRGATGNQKNVVELSSSKVCEIFDRYLYGDVTAGVALGEMGYSVDPKKTIETLDLLLPPTLDQLVVNADTQYAYLVKGRFLEAIGEDPRVFALKIGKAIGRYDWDLIRPMVETRIAAVIAAKPDVLKQINKIETLPAKEKK